MNNAAVNVCVQPESLLSLLLGMYPEVELLLFQLLMVFGPDF